MPLKKAARRAFTLVELLVVLGIIMLLISVLLPALSKAGEAAKSVQCLSNLRQMALMAHNYAVRENGRFPIAKYTTINPPLVILHYWDFTRRIDGATITVEPGILWMGQVDARVQQCPSFDGASNATGDPYTGYNYNTSYIGHGEGEAIVAPAKVSQVRASSECALFGDGQWLNGANKYMRAPLPNPGDTVSNATRLAGTQGFRHRGRTNVAFADGHAESLEERFGVGVAPGTGFLSEDNRLYDLE